MTAPNRSDPYEGNILVEPLGPILSRPEVLKRTLTRKRPANPSFQ